jgi:hypothetical protein
MSAAKHTHGCCADKACDDKTCMELPAGKTCGDCAHVRHCMAFYAHTLTDTYCDFFPRRFKERAALAKATGGAA